MSFAVIDYCVRKQVGTYPFRLHLLHVAAYRLDFDVVNEYVE